MESIAKICSTLPEKVGSDPLKPLATALVGETEDSDPKVREASITALAAIGLLAKSRGRLAQDAWKVVANLETAMPKVFKRVQAVMEAGGNPAAASASSSAAPSMKFSASEPSTTAAASTVTVKKVPAANSLGKTTSSLPPSTGAGLKKVSSGLTAASMSATTGAGLKKSSGGSSSATAAEDDQVEDLTLSSEEAINQLAAMEIPGWTETGLLAMESAKWQGKVEALGAIERRLSELQESSGGTAQYAAALVKYLSATSSGFKISNINILKATLQTAVALVKSAGASAKFNRSAGWELLKALGDKLADKKTKDAVQQLMTALSETISVAFVVKRMKVVMDRCISPLAHQYYLEWLKEAISEFGCGAFPVPQIGSFCTAEMENKNATVRTTAVEVMGALHHQIGPRLAAIAFSDDMKPQLKALVEAEFAKVGYDPAAAAKAPKAAVGAAAAASGGSAAGGGAGGGSSCGGIPRQDLCSLVDKNIVSELNFTEGKTSWQRRKAALESIIAACERSTHFLDANKPTGEVVKALKGRMADTQANLKPIAVSAIAHVVASLDQRSAGVKVLGSMAASMMLGLADNKKPMRDSTIAALQMAVTGHTATEGAATAQADSAMLMACIPASAESLVNVVGRQELLAWLLQHAESLKGDCSELVVPLILTLQDKAAIVRSTGEQLLTSLLAQNLTSKATLDKATRDLPPATKRGMQASIDRMMAAHGTAPLKTAAVTTATTTAAPSAVDASSIPPSPPRRTINTTSVPDAALSAPVSPPKAPIETRGATVSSTPARSTQTATAGAKQPTQQTPGPQNITHSVPVPGSAISAQWMLKRNAMGKQRRQEEVQRLNWPQPPDEPGEMEIAALKVVWRPIVTPDLAFLLFPIVRPGSPVNQDVYVPAMNELSTQLLCPYLTHHTEFLLRWICIVLCLKQESGPGLLRLLQLICDLLESFHREAGDKALTDAEVSCILPHLVDRSGHRSEKHSALYRHAITLMGQVISPTKLVSALISGLHSNNKRSRVICLEELQRIVECDGADALPPSALREVALCLDNRDCDNTGRGACLSLIACYFNASGGDIAKLKKSLGSDISDVTLSMIEDRLGSQARRPPATPSAGVAASAGGASSLSRTPSSRALPTTQHRTPLADSVISPVLAPPAAVTEAIEVHETSTPAEKLAVDIEKIGRSSSNKDVWAMSTDESAGAALTPTSKMMLDQIDQVVAATPMHQYARLDFFCLLCVSKFVLCINFIVFVLLTV